MLPLTPAHLPDLFRLAEEIWLPTFAPLFSAEELKALYTGMYNRDALLEWTQKSGNSLYFIVPVVPGNPEQNLARPGQAIGYLGLEHEGEILKLDKIYVHPQYQGRGVGSWAMNWVIAFAKNAGCKQIKLRVNRQNSNAISFYERWNFEMEAAIELPAPNGYTYQDYLMCRRLE